MKFSLVAQTFDAIEKTSSRLEMTKLLSDLLQQTTPSESSIVCYLSLGQLYPLYIGTQFNLAEKNVTKTIAGLLHKSEHEITREAKKYGDLGIIVASGSWRVRDDLTVHQVYNDLKHIEKLSGIGSQEEKIGQLRDLLLQLDPISAKYVVRIVIGKLRLGFSDMTVIDALSWMITGDKSLRAPIENAYNICADIGFIAHELKEKGIKAIEAMKIHIGVPIRPAAAERMPTAKAIIKKVGVCVAQPKLDGFRLQIHIDKTGKKTHIEFFSRNLQKMTPMFPELVKEFSRIKVKTMICEGEAIAYDPNTGSFLPFQETVKRKRKHGIAEAKVELPLQVFIFDLLYLNGRDLLNESHEQRREKLLHLFKSFKSDIIHVVEEKKITTVQELEHYFAQNIASGLEGLVVKRPDAVYQPGKRNFNWIKLKRQEEGKLEDTIDCVILGYYAGRGRRADFGIGAFLVGVFDPNKDRFETIAKVGTGLKDKDWKELKKKCDEIKSLKQPHNIECAKELFPDVWVYPEIVCLVRADEITLSPVHTAGKTKDKFGYALRFPRFMGYRPDKSARQATTIKEISTLYRDQFSR